MRIATFLKAAMIGVALSLAACTGSDTPAAGDQAENTPQLVVHRPFRAGEGSVNSFWLEGPDEILVMDTQGNLDLASRVVARIRETGKPVTAIVISHYHPDHFGGLQVFLEAFPDAQLLMPEEIAEKIDRDLSGYVERLRETVGDDYQAPPEPDGFIENRQEMEVSGVPIIFHIVDRSESSPIAMIDIPSQRVLIASDLVSNRMHPDLTDADIDSWPRALDRIAREFPDYQLYPGHGEPGSASLLVANQIAYLNFVRGIIENDILDDDRASEEEIADAIVQIRRNYPDWPTTTGQPMQLRRNLETLVADMGGRVDRRERNAAAEEEEGGTASD